ncbi:protein translocase subunit SecD [Paenibacillus sp. 32O-W]|uniref:protein translocase subunit SecD n=1 Tax=Paenibacillus sp. 32O-W TaxID=1695218 RepID=UPI0011A2BBBF|nr:protein translocase subunit SecD [Paenibacillus sp. 32O-W]
MDGKRMAAFVLLVVITLGVITWTSPQLLSKVRLGLDLRGGFEILYVATPAHGEGEVTQDALRETAKSLEKRVNAQGIAEPEITPEGKDRIRVRIAGVTDEAKVREMLKKPAVLTFRGPDGNIELDGTDFKPGKAKVEYENGTTPIVSIELKNAEKFAQVTGKLIGQNLGIYLDDQMISNPRVNYVINSDKATITGHFTYDEAKNLADTINLGALPLNLTEKYTQSVGATLGQLSLEQTVKAGLIAFVLIILFMIIFYRVPGIIASITLISFTWLLLLVFVLMNATLTLPGIAAFVLGVGMAVDANIITYERIKEEMRSGKSVLSSLRAGSKNSFRTIMDANITTILAGAVLYFLGTGAIQGFALTLIFSILISIITNVFFSRLLLHLLIRSNAVKKPGYFGVKEAEIRAL